MRIALVIVLMLCMQFFSPPNSQADISEEYSVNPLLSQLLEQEELTVGMPRPEAIKKYGLIRQRKNDSFNPSLVNMLEQPTGIGVYRGTFGGENQELLELFKCIAVESKEISYEEAVEAFQKKYGQALSSTKALTYRIKHRGRFITFQHTVKSYGSDHYTMEYHIKDDSAKVQAELEAKSKAGTFIEKLKTKF